MTASEALEKLLRSYVQYYDVIRENVQPPFATEARFHSHGETYVLVKSARISEADSHEYVYFAAEESVDLPKLMELDAAAWERGIAFVKPHSAHRNSDVTLIVLADHIDPEALAAVKKLKHYKSYSYRLQGWSNYRAVALETSSGTLVYNRLGRELKKLFRNISNQR